MKHLYVCEVCGQSYEDPEKAKVCEEVHLCETASMVRNQMKLARSQSKKPIVLELLKWNQKKTEKSILGCYDITDVECRVSGDHVLLRVDVEEHLL